MLKKAKTGLEPILKDLQSNTLTKLCYSAFLFYKIVVVSNNVILYENKYTNVGFINKKSKK